MADFGPAEKMRLARELAAMAFGIEVEQFPPDADVECALGEDGVLHVHASVRARGVVPSFVGRITLSGRFTP